ncbi:MAG: hypothetical protein RMJ19_06325 [Gemmatales bacterium]|nr:hypothetical protein [Gemmatales bacterium]MCS7160070.1 hypothetical protein [Gemmatales bacterium]MDW8175270.1 hypothetical protein [Gemmatales bacterium]MDW8223878.1 hypothetical protein [Gemmatales bacterium]
MPALIAKERIWRRLLGAARKHLHIRLPQARPVLEQMLYAICRRNCARDAADAAFERLQRAFTDWNEVRVSALREVADVLAPLPEAFTRAEQITSLLDDVFNSQYSFDLEGLRNKPLQQATRQLARWRHADEFVIAWTCQYALGAHALPLDETTQRVVVRLGLVADDSLASAQSTLERQVRKRDAAPVYETLSAIAHRYCLAEPLCQDCCLRNCCPTARKSLSEATNRVAVRRKPR